MPISPGRRVFFVGKKPEPAGAEETLPPEATGVAGDEVAGF
jgi:hypothetical protein